MHKYQIEALKSKGDLVGIVRLMAELYQRETSVYLRDAIEWAKENFVQMPMYPADLGLPYSLRICKECGSERGRRPFCLYCYKQNYPAARAVVDKMGLDYGSISERREIGRILGPILGCDPGHIVAYMSGPTD